MFGLWISIKIKIIDLKNKFIENIKTLRFSETALSENRKTPHKVEKQCVGISSLYLRI